MARWKRVRGAGGLAAAGLALAALAPGARADDAATARARLLCAQLSGDLTDPVGMMQFKRCLASRDPRSEMIRQNIPRRPARPVANPLAGLAAHQPVALIHGSSNLTPGAAPAARTAAPAHHACAAGFTAHRASGGARVCVRVQAR